MYQAGPFVPSASTFFTSGLYADYGTPLWQAGQTVSLATVSTDACGNVPTRAALAAVAPSIKLQYYNSIGNGTALLPSVPANLQLNADGVTYSFQPSFFLNTTGTFVLRIAFPNNYTVYLPNNDPAAPVSFTVAPGSVYLPLVSAAVANPYTADDSSLNVAVTVQPLDQFGNAFTSFGQTFSATLVRPFFRDLNENALVFRFFSAAPCCSVLLSTKLTRFRWAWAGFRVPSSRWSTAASAHRRRPTRSAAASTWQAPTSCL